MAIQGIIKGFANPNNLQEHVLLVARDLNYTLIEDGRAKGASEDLDEGLCQINQAAKARCTPDWKQITGTTTDAMGHTMVTGIGRYSFGD